VVSVVEDDSVTVPQFRCMNQWLNASSMKMMVVHCEEDAVLVCSRCFHGGCSNSFAKRKEEAA